MKESERERETCQCGRICHAVPLSTVGSWLQLLRLTASHLLSSSSLHWPALVETRIGAREEPLFLSLNHSRSPLGASGLQTIYRLLLLLFFSFIDSEKTTEPVDTTNDLTHLTYQCQDTTPKKGTLDRLESTRELKQKSKKDVVVCF